MTAPASLPSSHDQRRQWLTAMPWLSDGIILTAASFLAAAGNYLFQALMRRHLSWSEFGYMNATLSLILFAGVPLTAASQTFTHHLAQARARGDEEKRRMLEAASLKFLRHLSWVLFALCLLFLYPVADFLRFPRMSLAWMALLWIPLNLWSALGGAWCSGLSRFRLLSFLLILTAVVRVSMGALATSLYPWAEAGVFATLLSGLVLAAVALFNPHHGTASRLRETLFQRDLLVYGTAALAVSFGAFVFLQGDQLAAQRHFPGEELGRYTGAGLLGRMIVWASLPVLTVYFTRRSGHDSSRESPVPLLWIYLAMIAAGALGVLLLRVSLLALFLGAHDPELTTMTVQFVWAMVPIGILQALGCHYLAARRIPECIVFGLCGLAYLVVLLSMGHTPELMLNAMAEAAAASILLLSGLTVIRRLAFRPKL